MTEAVEWENGAEEPGAGEPDPGAATDDISEGLRCMKAYLADSKRHYIDYRNGAGGVRRLITTVEIAQIALDIDR